MEALHAFELEAKNWTSLESDYDKNAKSRRDSESNSDSESSNEMIEAELIAYQEFFRIL